MPKPLQIPPPIEHASFDFGGAVWDLADPSDRAIVGFILSQALFGEATGVYCGKSLYAARSLEAARFYVRQAHQELNHLTLFGEMFELLGMTPTPAHWVVRLLSSHNNYYPLKVLMEHAIGEGMVHDIFKDVLLQTLPDDYPGVPEVKKRLRAILLDEAEHVGWGEKETRRILGEQPWLATPFYGLVELQMLVAPFAVRTVGYDPDHPVLKQTPAFIDHVVERVFAQGRDLGFVPAQRKGVFGRLTAMGAGALLYLRSQLARGRSTLDKTYIAELGLSEPTVAPLPKP